jgi:signal recognition particle receptor subunit beta
MPQINVAKREIICKLVYYGPGVSGKTTNLQVVHKRAPLGRKSELVSVATEGDRTLFFDYMPLELGTVAGMKVKLQLYTVPGQEYYNATRELVLRGADGVVFVADSQADLMDKNQASLANLEENLLQQGVRLRDLPVVLQWNKRDMPDALPVETLERELNRHGWPSVAAIAVTGEGVFPTLRKLAQLVLEKLHGEYVGGGDRAERSAERRARTPDPEARRREEEQRLRNEEEHARERAAARRRAEEQEEARQRAAALRAEAEQARARAAARRRTKLALLVALLLLAVAAGLTDARVRAHLEVFGLGG